MRRLLTLALFVCLLVPMAAARERAWGWCQLGGQQVFVSNNGSKHNTTPFSNTYWMRSFPSCTITVYLTGTNVLATIYSDNIGTPLANPFTATSNGYWKFYADSGKYDVQESNANLPAPFTYSDVQLCDISTESCGTSGTGPHNLLSTTHQDTIPYSPPTQGDMVLGGGASKWQRLAGPVATTTKWLAGIGDGVSNTSVSWNSLGGDCAAFGQVIDTLNSDGTVHCVTPPSGIPGLTIVTSTIQAAITTAATTGSVLIPSNYAGLDTFTNPNSRPILDIRNIDQGGMIDVRSFGAGGSGRGWYSSVSGTSGSAAFGNVLATAGTAPQIGQTFVVARAGLAGADLSCTIANVVGNTVTCGGGVTSSATGTFGARWGWTATVDDTAAFTAAKNFCAAVGGAQAGCKVVVPRGLYFVSNVTVPAQSGTSGAVTLGQFIWQGAGRRASLIIGIGADQTGIFNAPASSVPMSIRDLGFYSWDYTNHTQTPAIYLGGVSHEFRNNEAQNVYEMVRMVNVQLAEVSFNRCFSAVNCIRLGPAGTGPINASLFSNNELSSFSNYGILSDATGSGGSQQNTYIANNCENTPGPYQGCAQMNDKGSIFMRGYLEAVPPSNANGYYYDFTGNSNTLISAYPFNCMHLAGAHNTVMVSDTSNANACPTVTWWIKNDSNTNKFIGISPTDVSAAGSEDAFIGVSRTGAGAQFNSSLSSYQYVIGTANDRPYGRVDLAGVPHMQSSSDGLNPAKPTNFGASATFPYMSFIYNRDANIATPNAFIGWLCRVSPNCANPFNATEWVKVGIQTKVRAEGTTAPASGSWTVGDFVWNTSSTSGLMGWICTASGSPGTWLPVYPAPGVTQQARVTTGSIAASSGADVTLTWPAAFSNTSYTPVCSVTEATTTGLTLRVHHVESVSTTNIVVRVINDDGAGAHTGTLGCMAVHD